MTVIVKRRGKMGEAEDVYDLCSDGAVTAVAALHGGRRLALYRACLGTPGGRRTLARHSDPARHGAGVPSAAPVSILVADDDDAIAALVREVLEGEGYRIAVAPTHAAALAALRDARYALVLADTEGAPVADDDPAHWDSVEEVLAAAGDTPVAIFSAHAPSAFAGWPARGFAGLVSKPFDLDDLVAVVRALVGPA